MANEEDQGGRRVTSMRIEDKLTLGELLHEAWTLMRGGSSSSVNRVLKIARQYPMPAAIISLGLGWMVYQGIRDDEREVTGRRRRSALYTDNDFAGQARDTVGDIADSASDLRDHARVAVREAQIRFWQTLEKQPLTLGAVTLGAALVVGVLRRHAARG
jgi:hypothetical protein